MGLLDVPAISRSQADGLYAKRTTRRAALGFGTAGDNGTFSTGSINPRYPIRIAVDTVRWRLKLANSDIKNAVAGTAGQQFRGAWIGPHLMGTTEGTGNFTQTPVAAIPNPDAAIPVDNSYYVSPWVTDPAAQIPAAVDYLLSIQTYAAASTPIWRTNVGSFLSFAAGTGGTTAPNPSQNKAGMFDLIIEFEYVDNGRNRMGFFVGDSITAGLGGDNTVGNPSPYSYPQQHGLRTGHAVINAGCAGDQATPWAPGTGPRWTRFDIGTYLPDYAVVLFGTNDMTGLISVATYQTNIAAIVAKLRSLGVPRVFLGLVPPKNGRVAGTLTAAASAGATSITSSVSFANGSTIGIGLGANQEFVTTNGAPTGSGPYTIPVPALANAHSSGELVADQQESLRQGYNNWLKSIPAGATGIVDFDSVLRDPVNQIALRSDWTTDGVHMTRAGYQRMAATVPVP